MTKKTSESVEANPAFAFPQSKDNGGSHKRDGRY